MLLSRARGRVSRTAVCDLHRCWTALGWLAPPKRTNDFGIVAASICSCAAGAPTPPLHAERYGLCRGWSVWLIFRLIPHRTLSFATV